MENRGLRKEAVKEGNISPEQARKEKNKNRLQDVASIGIAALGLKGAYSELKETREMTKEMRETEEKRKRHAAKREARRRKQSFSRPNGYLDSDYTGSMPNLSTVSQDPYYGHPSDPYGQHPAAFHSSANLNSNQNSFIYADDNPYGALTQRSQPQAGFQSPPPPMTGQPYVGVPRTETY
jgi:hypothetical protein